MGAVRLGDAALMDARLFVAAVPGSPVRLPQVEAVLEGGSASDPDLVESALAAFDATSLDFVGDVHASADFRRHLTRVQLKRLVGDIAKEAAAA